MRILIVMLLLGLALLLEAGKEGFTATKKRWARGTLRRSPTGKMPAFQYDGQEVHPVDSGSVKLPLGRVVRIKLSKSQGFFGVIVLKKKTGGFAVHRPSAAKLGVTANNKSKVPVMWYPTDVTIPTTAFPAAAAKPAAAKPAAPGAVNLSNRLESTSQKNMPGSGDDWKQTNISFYGQNAADDNGEGFVGVKLFELGKSGLKFKGRNVYPVAVHHDHASKYLYHVLEVTSDKLKPGFLGYVVDICDRADSACKNVKKNDLNFLVDIHKTGFAAAGMSDGLHIGKFRDVGVLPAKDIPKNSWINDYVMCKCKGPCGENDQDWRPDFSQC